MHTSQQRAAAGPRVRGRDRSLARRAELIAIGQKLFADTSYDALSMDDIARHAGVAKGLIYYYFQSKRGYYLAIVRQSALSLAEFAGSGLDLPAVDRVHRTIDSYLRFAERNREAYRALTTGGVGFDTEVQAVRSGVRDTIIDTLAQGAYGRTDIPCLARTALLGWLCSVEGITLDWIGRFELERDDVRALLVRLLRRTLDTIEEFEPACPSPPDSGVLLRTGPDA